MTGLKKRNQKEATEPENVNPYAHLNLVWKPLMKANMQSATGSINHNPMRISLAPIDTSQSPLKVSETILPG